jgi:hypothetical protein
MPAIAAQRIRSDRVEGTTRLSLTLFMTAS